MSDSLYNNVFDWDENLARTTLHLVAGRLFGPEIAAKGLFTSDDVISAMDTVMDIYLNVTFGAREGILP
jgi:hypothetical protein